jgi:hypothetical protein
MKILLERQKKTYSEMFDDNPDQPSHNTSTHNLTSYYNSSTKRLNLKDFLSQQRDKGGANANNIHFRRKRTVVGESEGLGESRQEATGLSRSDYKIATVVVPDLNKWKNDFLSTLLSNPHQSSAPTMAQDKLPAVTTLPCRTLVYKKLKSKRTQESSTVRQDSNQNLSYDKNLSNGDTKNIELQGIRANLL